MYICTVESNSTLPREYEVETKSAMRCAKMYGRCEGDETVTVRTKSGRIVSCVRWTPQDGGQYYYSTHR